VCAAPVYEGTEEFSGGEKIPGKELIKEIPLSSETVTQIPKYLTAGNILYILDEEKIEIQETGYGRSERADVVTVTEKTENLPDNDLTGIRKTVPYEGVNCELLCVVFEITGRDKNGIPDRYTALCEYGGLKKYSRFYASDWQAVVYYDAYEVDQQIQTPPVWEKYVYRNTVSENKTERPGNGEEKEETEEESRNAAEKKLMMKKTPHQEKEEERTNPGKFWIPLAAVFLLSILLSILYILYKCLSPRKALLYALTARGKYRYIGQLTIKERENIYLLCLSKRLIAKAEILSFRLKMPDQAVKKAEGKRVKIQCPGGRMVMLNAEKETEFVLEMSER